MHACNPTSHENASECDPHKAHFFAAGYEQSDCGGQDCSHEREYYGRPVILHGDRQMESEHSNVMHRPDANAHGNSAAADPAYAAEAPRGSHSRGQIERGK